MDTKFQAREVEEKWYKYWVDREVFTSSIDSEKPPYTVVIPPPNVTGILHMGHMLNATIQDVLVRRARMKGYNACWVPGTDHASIATEIRVTKHLKERGIEKRKLSKEEFLVHARAWTQKHGGIILEQLKRIGASCDWSKEKFTMDPDMNLSVTKTFKKLYEEGLIYRGHRMIHWDPEAQTTLSDEEVIHTPQKSDLYFVKYFLADDSGAHLTVATTRIETIFADVALCVNPSDDRYRSQIGREVYVPLTQRKISVIADDYVDVAFGTGCLKITPAHDFNDYEIGKRHDLPLIDMFNPDGTVNQHGGYYHGKDRFKTRKEIAVALEDGGYLAKITPYDNSVGRSERTHAVVEPRLSVQWFLKMESLARVGLDALEQGEFALVPEKFGATYRHWLKNIKDWNISRQLYWGHSIPVYYHPSDPEKFVVAENPEEAAQRASETWGRSFSVEELRPERDVLDTWFSSWLWPVSVFDGVNAPENAQFRYYYPTQVLVTAPEILFFWVARMVMFGKYHTGEVPFKKVYLTGIVRDEKRRKMSKSLGNSPDPLDLIDRYGADAVRVGMLFCSPAGNDLLFREELCLQGRNFTNKIWNAFRLVTGWSSEDEEEPSAGQRYAMKWFEHKLRKDLKNIDTSFDRLKISGALQTMYKLVWDDFCSWYLEAVKPAYLQKISSEVRDRTLGFFQTILEALHPFMPFLTEELGQKLQTESTNPKLMVETQWESPVDLPNSKILDDFHHIQNLISELRKLRKDANLSKSVETTLYHSKEKSVFDEGVREMVLKMGQTLCVDVAVPSDLFQKHTFLIDTQEYVLVLPIEESETEEIDQDALKKEIEHYSKFAASIEKKLSNETFCARAPREVIARENKKLNDTKIKLQMLKVKLDSV